MTKTLLFFCIIFLSIIFNTQDFFSQSISPDSLSIEKHGLTVSEWEKVNKRWSKLQPSIFIVTTSGDTVVGQLISISSESLTICTDKIIPFNDFIEGKTKQIAINNISSIIFTKEGYKRTGLITGFIAGGGAGVISGLIVGQGWTVIPAVLLGTVGATGGMFLGKRIQEIIKTSEISMDSDPQKIEKYLNRLQKHAIHPDNLIADKDLNHFAKHSKNISKVFPEKHLRISFGLSVGPNFVKSSLDDMLSATSLPPITKYRTDPLAVEFFDLAWRFSDKFIIGGQLSLNLGNYSYLFYDNHENLYYNNKIQNFESRIYFEYSPNPVTRLFTKKYEFLFGGGIVFANPSSKFIYSYTPDIATGDNIQVTKQYEPNLLGVQLRSAFHYYIFPGFSVSAGIEGNIIQPLSIDSYQLPTSNPTEFITIPDYKLNFSTIRIKIGASIYL
ncbi:MAG: hypothetical protein PHW82_04530 [Bacteroidales bacterium]|nr:hypothetical protein [Bacteroidales bacterium]